MADVCVQWEKAITTCNVDMAILRTGVVLSDSGGALTKMPPPIKLGLGAALGNGQQLMPWIHIDDLCNIYIYFD